MYHDEQMVDFHVLVYFDVIIFTNSEKQEKLQVNFNLVSYFELVAYRP